MDFMSVYPPLTDLAEIPTLQHVEGKNLRPLLLPRVEIAKGVVVTFW